MRRSTKSPKRRAITLMLTLRWMRSKKILIDSAFGDILVFMPGEADIIETRDLIQARGIGDTELIPLFGRLASAEQQRVFAPSNRRKIVIATNIADSSLTVPGIRYVVDTGLARISRYNPRTRAKRLPIEPVAQSSANQRKGRCGRVAEGVCVRLYSEAEFLARPLFAQPEIQRANLAEVILHLKAFNLGLIEEFPFIEPPAPAAIQGGYQLLRELGALDDNHELTETRAAARLAAGRSDHRANDPPSPQRRRAEGSSHHRRWVEHSGPARNAPSKNKAKPPLPTSSSTIPSPIS